MVRSALPLLPLVARTRTTSAPRLTHLARVPAHVNSASSGWATTAMAVSGMSVVIAPPLLHVESLHAIVAWISYVYVAVATNGNRRRSLKLSVCLSGLSPVPEELTSHSVCLYALAGRIGEEDRVPRTAPQA